MAKTGIFKVLASSDSVLVLASVGDDDGGWLLGHVFNAAIALVQEVDFLLETLDFKLGVAGFEFARSHTTFEIFQFLDLAIDSFDVSQGAANPANCDVGHFDRFGSGFGRVFELFLGADEENLLAVSCDFSEFRKGFLRELRRFFRGVNNVLPWRLLWMYGVTSSGASGWFLRDRSGRLLQAGL